MCYEREEWINPWDQKRDKTREQLKISNFLFNFLQQEARKCLSWPLQQNFIRANNFIQRIDKMLVNDLARVKTEKEIAMPYQIATRKIQDKMKKLERENERLKADLEMVGPNLKIAKDVQILIDNIKTLE